MQRNLIIGLFLIICACVSKKEHQLLVSQNEELTHQVKTALDKSEKAQDSYEKLRDNLLAQNSLNNQLLAEKIKLQADILSVEQRLGNLSNEAQNRQNALNKELAEQNQVLSQKQARLKIISEAYQKITQQQEDLLIQLTRVVGDVNDFDMEVELTDRVITLVLYDKFTFTPAMALTASGVRKMEMLAQVLKNKSQLSILIVGHTGPDAGTMDKKWTDLLELSMYKAAVLARFLVRQGLTLELTPAGKGANAPRVSNETQAGKELNNRIEIHFLPHWSTVFKLIEEG